jgi:hypothetical protein
MPEPKKANAQGGCGCLALLLVFCVMIGTCRDSKEREAIQKELAATEDLWRSGNKAEAVRAYRKIIENKESQLVDSEGPLVYGRVIDYDARNGKADLAKELLVTATRRKIEPLLYSAEAKAIQAKLEAELAKQKLQEEERKQEEQRREQGQREAAERMRIESGMKIEAWVMAQEFVKSRLKSPSTASFGGFSDYQNPVQCVTPLGNAFGAMLRADFALKVQYVDKDKWRLVGDVLLVER